ncbi:LysE family translocator [Cupriavidus agavae]|uniref:Threonine/homoserine/homoserine lactone efflux protein n=1 Tax=Cupriavidus agavae TaxID=1001822 RepID=A0A4Q7R9S1_9BURK|nr:LysE family translocator [Cupriavidus agavae]RZT29646.1 threonine/homoserine/homoserine lactone efflux protein [Cupriavidus agavae]
MDTTTLFLYLVAVATVMVTPGPTMLLALSNGATRPVRVTACGIAGAALADLILIGAVGCGLGAVLQASELLFSAIKWIGAAYLLYLAVAIWRAPTHALVATTDASSASGRAAFLRALFVAVSNPKAILFTSAFVPQFVHADKPVALQYAILAVVAALMDILMMAIYAFGGRHAVRSLSGRAVQWINRGCAGMLAFLAVGLSLYRRSDLR